MMGFFEAFVDEAVARRQRIATTIGPRFQGVFDLAILGGVIVGSGGLFVRPWMPAAATWGFAIPVVFIVGHLLLDARRQSQLAAGGDPEAVAKRADLFAVVWGVACAALGLIAFFTAWGAAPEPPPPPPIEEWTPPEDAVAVEVVR